MHASPSKTVVRMQQRSALSALPRASRQVSAAKKLRCGAAKGVATSRQPISLSDDALRHLKKLREDNGGKDLLLRVGVKSGGCSGMSYTLDFEEASNVEKEDTTVEYEDFKLVTDRMSMMYLLGMTLDYSNKLIGGGFIFQNPNAQSSCGCGKSFGV